MKKPKNISFFILLAFVVLVSSVACESFNDIAEVFPELNFDDTSDTSGTPDSHDAPDTSDGTADISQSHPPLLQAPAVSYVLMPVASGERVERNSNAAIDYSNTTDGYVMVKWIADTSKELRIRVIGPSELAYTYRISPDDTFEVFPLTDGNGSYDVKAMEQTPDGRYSVALSANLSVDLKDEFVPFLHPNQFVNFDEESDVVGIAAQLSAGLETLPEKIAAVYQFVIKNISYDMDLADAIKSGDVDSHIPDLDMIVATGKGICFDYSAVMAAMLRSQAIPTKMVFGHVDDVYHAWISVYSEETGWIESVIFFDGESWVLMDPTFASSSRTSAALNSFIGGGNKYTPKYQY